MTLSVQSSPATVQVPLIPLLVWFMVPTTVRIRLLVSNSRVRCPGESDNLSIKGRDQGGIVGSHSTRQANRGQSIKQFEPSTCSALSDVIAICVPNGAYNTGQTLTQTFGR